MTDRENPYYKLAEMLIIIAGNQDIEKEELDRIESTVDKILAKFYNGFRSEVKTEILKSGDLIKEELRCLVCEQNEKLKKIKDFVWSIFWAVTGICVSSLVATIVAIALMR